MAVGGLGALVGRLLEALSYEPFAGLYVSLLERGRLGFVVGEGYVNLVHQVDLYTEYLVRDPVRLLVADEIGLGKTVEALRLVKYAVRSLGARRVLIVVPANLLVQWREEDAQALGVPMRVIDRGSVWRLWETLRHAGDIPEGVYIGSMDTLKLDERRAGSPYWELVSSVGWDLVVVDEAHKLGVVRGEASLRYKRIGELCRRARHCLLLTATPTRGDLRDFLERLSLLDPSLRVRTAVGRISREDRSALELLGDLRRYLVVRRSKEVLRYSERGFRVPDATFLLGVLQLPGWEARFYEDVYRIVGRLLAALGHRRELGLLRALLVKRALSSPLGFLRTLRRILEGAGEPRASRVIVGSVESVLYEDEREPPGDVVVEPDRLEDALLAAIRSVLTGRLRAELVELAGTAERLAREGDSAVRALSTILARAASGEPLLGGDPDTVYPNILVFTEYKDTLEHIQRQLQRLLPAQGLERLPDDTAAGLLHRAGGAQRSRVPVEWLRGSVEAYQSRGGLLIIVYVSSDNSRIIPLVAEAVRRTGPERGVSVAVVSTDVAGEGLNLQGANVLLNYEVTWSMVRREQRVGRVWRIGQRRRVYVVDFVRGTPLDRMIYERLLSKIYMLSLATGAPLATGPSGIALIRASEEREARVLRVVTPQELSAGRVLEGVAGALERLPEGVELFDEALDRLATELLQRLEAYKSMARILAGESPRRQAERARESARALYGAESHEDALTAIRALARACGLLEPRDMGEALVHLSNNCSATDGVELPVHLVVEPGTGLEGAMLGVLRFTRRGRTVLALPVLAETRRGELTEYYGYEAVGRLAWLLERSTLLSGGMITQLPGADQLRRSGLARPLEEAARRVGARVLNALTARSQHSIVRPGERLYRTGILGRRPGVDGIALESVELLAVFYGSGPDPAEGDTASRREVEEAGIRVVARLFEERGYYVEDVHLEGRPYDLIARPRSRLFDEGLLVEVKAHRGARLSGVLTEREARTAEENPDRYIVCVVAHATSESPLVVCRPYREWRRTPLEVRRVEGRVLVRPNNVLEAYSVGSGGRAQGLHDRLWRPEPGRAPGCRPAPPGPGCGGY